MRRWKMDWNIYKWPTAKKVYVRETYSNGIQVRTSKNEGNIDIPFWGNRVLEIAQVYKI